LSDQWIVLILTQSARQLNIRNSLNHGFRVIQLYVLLKASSLSIIEDLLMMLQRTDLNKNLRTRPQSSWLRFTHKDALASLVALLAPLLRSSRRPAMVLLKVSYNLLDL